LFTGIFMPAIRATSITFNVQRRRLALPLLVTLVAADHPHNTVAANDFAVPAHFFDRCPDFHSRLLNWFA